MLCPRGHRVHLSRSLSLSLSARPAQHELLAASEQAVDDEASLLVSNVWGLKPNEKHRPRDTLPSLQILGRCTGPARSRDSGRLKVCLSKDAVVPIPAWHTSLQQAHQQKQYPSSDRLLTTWLDAAVQRLRTIRSKSREPSTSRRGQEMPVELIAMFCVCVVVHHGAGTGRHSELYGRARSERWLQSVSSIAPAEH
jgi:hypothetical protein